MILTIGNGLLFNSLCLYTFLDPQVVLVVRNLPANAGDIRYVDSVPGSGRSPGGGNGNPLQYCCLGNPMDRGVRWVTIHGAAESQT